jgi:drug/metabolite transporter (DMT)-like permease
MESSIIDNTMLIQIALLAWLFLGETLTRRMVLGMVLAGLGTLLVEIRRQRPARSERMAISNRSLTLVTRYSNAATLQYPWRKP